MTPSRTGHLAALGGFILLAVAYTWPLAPNLTSRVPHDLGDPVLNTWILWWNARVLPFTEAWWSPPIFYPLRNTLALSEHLAGVALFTSPLQLAGMGPLTAYNLAFIFSSALSGFFTCLLVRYLLTREGAAPSVSVTVAALAGGIAFGFAPFRASHFAHLQVLTTQWMPLALLAMHRYADGASSRWLAVFGAAWVVQALSNGYYLLFLPVLLVFWLLWFPDWRGEGRPRGAALVLTWAGSSLLLIPTLLRYREVHDTLGLGRALSEMRMFSGTFAAFAHTGHQLRFWPQAPAGTQEAFLFPGVTAVAVVIAAAVLRVRIGEPGRRPAFWFYAPATLIMWWLALGPADSGHPVDALLRPYTLLTYFPGFNGLRVPARFAMLGYLTLAVAAGLAVHRLRPGRRGLALAGAAALFAGLALDSATTPMPLHPPPGRVLLPSVNDAAFLEIPVDEDQIGAAAMYRAMLHRLPLVNGYSGHRPPHYRILAIALRRGDPSVLTELARRRPLIVGLHSQGDNDSHFQRVVESVPGVQPLGATSAGRLYLVPRQPSAPTAALGAPLPLTIEEFAPERIIVDLGEPRVVRTVAFPLRWHYEELGARFAIEGSLDGRTWTMLWFDWTGDMALGSALDHPREIPMRFTLPDPRVRFLRVHVVPRWMQRELSVHGPA